MVAEKIGGKELQSHVVVVDVFLRGGITHQEAEDIVAVSELQLAIVVFEEGGGYNVFAGVCHGRERRKPTFFTAVRVEGTVSGPRCFADSCGWV